MYVGLQSLISNRSEYVIYSGKNVFHDFFSFKKKYFPIVENKRRVASRQLPIEMRDNKCRMKKKKKKKKNEKSIFIEMILLLI